LTEEQTYLRLRLRTRNHELLIPPIFAIMSSKFSTLPPMALFPEEAWKDRLVPEEWEASLDAWILLADAHLSLSTPDFIRISSEDQSLPTFLTSFAAEIASVHDISPSDTRMRLLRKQSFLLTTRLLDVDPPPEPLTRWEFLADISKMYGKSHGGKLVATAWKGSSATVELSMGLTKTALTKELDAGIKGDLKAAETQLKRLNHLLHASPDACAFFVAGSDFLDSLISCYKIMNPPLRRAILSTTYLCHIGLTEGGMPRYSTLVDQLYSLKSAAEAHKVEPRDVNDSLVAELVTVTPLLKQVQQRIDASGSGSTRAKSVISALEAFKKPGSSFRPTRLIIRKTNKGKEKATDDRYGYGPHDEIHIHRMSLISQVQDLFPDLGSGFVVKLLDEYNNDVEQVIAHLLEGSLPGHLENSDRNEVLYVQLLNNATPTNSARESAIRGVTPHLAPRSTPPQLPIRRNVFDDDELDQLAVDASRLHFGHRNPDQTADDILLDRSNAPNKAAILSALAAFDLDDDERDDTYDVADVGGTVDSAAPGNNPEEGGPDIGDFHDETLFRAYKTTPEIFDRDAGTRRGKPRKALRDETGLTDEAIEGWAVVLSRDPRQMRRLEAKFSKFSGAQAELAPTSWRANTAGSGTEDSDADGGGRGRGRILARIARVGRGRGRGNAAGPTGDKETEVARQRKEANKGSRANHNRRDQRAKKMARGGFPG
jgi:activating signal cointegrator complex subunit 2